MLPTELTEFTLQPHETAKETMETVDAPVMTPRSVALAMRKSFRKKEVLKRTVQGEIFIQFVQVILIHSIYICLPVSVCRCESIYLLLPPPRLFAAAILFSTVSVATTIACSKYGIFENDDDADYDCDAATASVGN